MPKDLEEKEELVPLNVLVPKGMKTWIMGLAYAESTPERKVSTAEVTRNLLEKEYREFLQKQEM